MCFVSTEGREIITTGLKNYLKEYLQTIKLFEETKEKNNTNHGRNNS